MHPRVNDTYSTLTFGWQMTPHICPLGARITHAKNFTLPLAPLGQKLAQRHGGNNNEPERLTKSELARPPLPPEYNLNLPHYKSNMEWMAFYLKKGF